MKKNKRNQLRRKKKHNEKIEKRHMEELYNIAKLLPNTLEGQSKLPIDIISPPKIIKSKKKHFFSWLF